ncbi:MAG: hypothetical protein OEV94_04845 [Deltaproteobacteria bacterium]|nr:hypothetical protein [Deltaproteobacteria bacterium]
MIVLQGASKDGDAVKHFRHTLSLGGALKELYRLYDQLGGVAGQADRFSWGREPGREPGIAPEGLGNPAGTPAGIQGRALNPVEQAIEQRMTGCLGEGRPDQRAKDKLQTLLRMRDLHRFITLEDDLRQVKLEWVEIMLFRPSLTERWAAIRRLLTDQVDRICQAPFPGRAVNQELYKEQLSRRNSRLGSLLVATALFHFDEDPEEPPENLMLRLKRNHFPEHVWEQLGPAQGSAWTPANPLCRWEYLAADLMHALVREARLERGEKPSRGWLGQAASGRNQTGLERESSEETARLFCRFPGESLGGADQMELLPTQPQAILPEAFRRIHQTEGAEAVRMAALLMEQLAESRPGERALVDYGELLSHPVLSFLPPGQRKARARKLGKVLGVLAGITCHRVVTQNGESTLATSRLVTILDRSVPWVGGKLSGGKIAGGELPGGELSGGQSHAGQSHDPVPPQDEESGEDSPNRRVSLYLDGVFFTAQGTLAEGFRELPSAVAGCDVKEHPFLMGLYAWLRNRGGHWEQAVSARNLLQEAGVWVSPTSRYRSLEILKRELTYLRELGFIGGWRMEKSPTRDGMDDLFLLSPAQPARRQNPA